MRIPVKSNFRSSRYRLPEIPVIPIPLSYPENKKKDRRLLRREREREREIDSCGIQGARLIRHYSRVIKLALERNWSTTEGQYAIMRFRFPKGCGTNSITTRDIVQHTAIRSRN